MTWHKCSNIIRHLQICFVFVYWLWKMYRIWLKLCSDWMQWNNVYRKKCQYCVIIGSYFGSLLKSHHLARLTVWLFRFLQRRGRWPLSVIKSCWFNHYCCTTSVVEVLDRMENLITLCLVNKVIWGDTSNGGDGPHIMSFTSHVSRDSRLLKWQRV